MEPLLYESASVDATVRLARGVAAVVKAGDLIGLTGPLGAGKTTFVRALCEALDVPRDAGVSSPSYALVNFYEGGVHPIAHLDLYRIAEEDELEALGFRDLLDGAVLVVVEWPERVSSVVELADLRIEIRDRGPEQRTFEFSVSDRDLRQGLAEQLLGLESPGA